MWFHSTPLFSAPPAILRSRPPRNTTNAGATADITATAHNPKMDIDDILASVDRGNINAPESATLDHQLLTRFWVAERAVSELLPWPTGLMDRMMERVRGQVSSRFNLPSVT